jgi:hypothetical protein
MILNKRRSLFVLDSGSSCCFLLSFLGSLVLNFLLGVFVLVGRLLVSNFLGSEGFLALLDFSDGLFGKGFLVLRSGSLELLDVLKGDSLNGSLLFEDSFLFVLALVGLFKFFMESSPGSGPSESLCFEFSKGNDDYT